jgi:hypothetical protein
MVEKPFESSTTAAAHEGTLLDSARGAAHGKVGVTRGWRSETATLVYAVSVAVALGIACGTWINAWLASAAASTTLAPTRSRPAAGATVQKTDETSALKELRLAEPHDASSTVEASAPSHGFGEPPGAETSRENRAGAPDKVSAAKRGGVPVPVAGEASPPRRTAVTPEVEKRATAQQGRAVPCALYASAGALTIRNGGAATLLVGGPGEAGRINVTTPHWSDIAVFSEGRTGSNGWVRYSVRSVSNRAGVYTVRFATPCGSQTIRVTVTRP